MRQRKRRSQASFFEDFRSYLLDELRAVLKILAVIVAIIYLVTSLFVGMYHVLVYLLHVVF